MNRRDFLKKASVAGAAAALPDGLGLLAKDTFAAGAADLAVVRGAEPAAITRAAIDALGGMRKFVSRGDIVVIKPNIGWDRVPEQAGNTNPHVVGEIVRMCVDAGAKAVKVFDRPVNDPRRCYVQSGIKQEAEKYGADVSYVDERKFSTVRINGLTLKDWPLYREILEADKVINVPIAKHHGLARLTMTMKNWMGVMGGRRSKIHQDLDRSLVDLAMTIKPALSVLDAVRILVDNGPQGGSLKDVRQTDTVIAGVDQVAIDSYGATLFGLEGKDLGYVREGHSAGLGTMNYKTLRLIEKTL